MRRENTSAQDDSSRPWRKHAGCRLPTSSADWSGGSRAGAGRCPGTTTSRSSWSNGPTRRPPTREAPGPVMAKYPSTTAREAVTTDGQSERSLGADIIIANAPDPVFVSDLEGKILQANDAVSQLL